MASSIVEELKSLRRREITKEWHHCTADEVAEAICSLLSEIILADDSECEKLADWEQAIGEQRCKILGKHVWEYDHCGYWGHQYCRCCRVAKYPELQKLRCSDAIAKVGRIKEEQYKPGSE